MARLSPRSLVRSRAATEAEAGFTLVEVLAALAIAAATISLAFQLFTSSVRLADRALKETAARDLARTLLAEGRSGEGTSGALHWTAARRSVDRSLSRRIVTVDWPGGPSLVWERLEASEARR